jgi:hypothetical protein
LSTSEEDETQKENQHEQYQEASISHQGRRAAGAAAGTALAAPPAIAQEPIRWRMQTYAGARWAST